MAFAETLLQRHLLGAAQDLAGICRGEGSARGPEKEVVRGALHRIYQCLSGVQACLPDFSHPGPQLSGDALHYNASVGIETWEPVIFTDWPYDPASHHHIDMTWAASLFGWRLPTISGQPQAEETV